jgi:amidase
VKLQEIDPKVSAVVRRDFDRAGTAWRAARADVAGPPTIWGFPLLGTLVRMPMPSPCGGPTRKRAIRTRQLKAARAIIVGKPTYRVTDWQSFNEVYGTGQQSLGREADSGGSSGGECRGTCRGVRVARTRLGHRRLATRQPITAACSRTSPVLTSFVARGLRPPESSAFQVRGDLSVTGQIARSAADSLVLPGGQRGRPPECQSGQGSSRHVMPGTSIRVPKIYSEGGGDGGCGKYHCTAGEASDDQAVDGRRVLGARNSVTAPLLSPIVELPPAG